MSNKVMCQLTLQNHTPVKHWNIKRIELVLMSILVAIDH